MERLAVIGGISIFILGGCTANGVGGGTAAMSASSGEVGETGGTTREADASTAQPPGSTGVDSTSGDEGESSDDATGGVELPEDGTLRVLSYNVAGLPDLISGSDPAVNTPLISPLLNGYDHVLVQEDFSYHAELSSDAMHPHRSTPGGGGVLGDGLSRFTESGIADFARHGWEACNGIIDSGSDCLTEKGFSVATHQLGPAAVVDIYNLHMDAGSSVGDIHARQAQVQQILDTIATRSAGRALIVAGDTNMDEEDEPELQALLTGANLLDACRELACGENYRIDRVMFRSSDTVELIPTRWAIDPAFVDGDANPLSDHKPVAVEFDWTQL